MKKVSAKKQSAKKQSEISKLATALKCDDATALKLATLEKQLMTMKQNKESAKCKVQRQRMRSLKFHRSEHNAETIALLQRIANTL